MTKAITAVAALRLVERGVLQLDRPCGEWLPELRDLPLLIGVDEAGTPQFAPEPQQVTLRQLLTHTAGFAYPWNHPQLHRVRSGPPAILVHRPGERWHYGTAIDWVGRLIETVTGDTLERHFRAEIFRPLGMTDSTFLLTPGRAARLVVTMQRGWSGMLMPSTAPMPAAPPCNGGGGLYSTGPDYLRFLNALQNGGAPLLGPKMMRELTRNQTGALEAGRLDSVAPERSASVDLATGGNGGFSLAFQRTARAIPNGRAAGSLSWAGIRNTFFWMDPRRGVAAVVMMQMLPFCHRAALAMREEAEQAVYRAS